MMTPSEKFYKKWAEQILLRAIDDETIIFRSEKELKEYINEQADLLIIDPDELWKWTVRVYKSL